jgi:1-deoxy-D-xylulose-5-phosphate reductoisomerase
MKKIALVGSTGSIGRQVIAVALAYPDKYKIEAIIADKESQLFFEQVALLKPKFAALAGVDKCNTPLNDDSVKFVCGEENALNVLADCCADVVFVACGGFAGLKYSLKAIELNCPLALANKETLVCGGDIIMPKVKEIMPVDSEHSAIWQCLNFKRDAKIKKLIITASGGPFRNSKWEELKDITPKQALNHPTWKMGKKITIDSSTLLNKGYEVIEAHHLYGTDYKDIITVIQPQSLIHSMVEFNDGAILAQMSAPTMELPIQLALTYPERLPTTLQPLDFTKAFSINFEPLVRERYPLYDLALKCGEAGGIYPTALNAASEEAVYAFLNGEIAYTDIFTVTRGVVELTNSQSVECYGQLELVDKNSRLKAKKIINEVQ